LLEEKKIKGKKKLDYELEFTDVCERINNWLCRVFYPLRIMLLHRKGLNIYRWLRITNSLTTCNYVVCSFNDENCKCHNPLFYEVWFGRDNWEHTLGCSESMEYRKFGTSALYNDGIKEIALEWREKHKTRTYGRKS